MFSKSRINEPVAKPTGEPNKPNEVKQNAELAEPNQAPEILSTSVQSPIVSILSSDLTVVGNLNTAGNVQVEGTIEGDIRAHLLTIGEGATVSGEVVADDIVINGHIAGCVRGLKVRLTSTAKVEGDIFHKTIAIESGAQFEGSVQRLENPLSTNKTAHITKE
ncbi:MAG: polymer-forming cytoskeletal protein [Paracoccaceae bacterium]|jgi:cytoskeletal protein CcmA (bactofilin family)